MSGFTSRIKQVGKLNLPTFSNVRILMMPFHLHNPHNTLPETLNHWKSTVQKLCDLSGQSGVGYLTIDEAHVKLGECHRRPGLHVDGAGSWGSSGSWGGGTASTTDRIGMLMVASHTGCRGWDQEFEGEIGEDGDCEHLRHELDPTKEFLMEPNFVYACNPGAMHEALPVKEDVDRQFVRLSMPSTHDWYESCTPNPLGIKAEGRVRPYRAKNMAYRP